MEVLVDVLAEMLVEMHCACRIPFSQEEFPKGEVARTGNEVAENVKKK